MWVPPGAARDHQSQGISPALLILEDFLASHYLASFPGKENSTSIEEGQVEMGVEGCCEEQMRGWIWGSIVSDAEWYPWGLLWRFPIIRGPSQ